MASSRRAGRLAARAAVALFVSFGLAGSGPARPAQHRPGFPSKEDQDWSRMHPPCVQKSLRNCLASMPGIGTAWCLKQAYWECAGEVDDTEDPLVAAFRPCWNAFMKTFDEQRLSYHGVARPSLPNEALTCRLKAVTAVLAASRPPAMPADFAGALADLDAVEPPALRQHLAGATRQVGRGGGYLESLRRTVERLDEMARAEDRLSQRLGLLREVSSLAEDWPSTEYALGLRTEHARGLQECLRSGWTRTPSRAAAEGFAFYDDWAALAYGASVVLGSVVPSGVPFCERALEFQCPARDLADWSSSCWSKERPSACGRDCPPDAFRMETLAWLQGVPCLDDPWGPDDPDLYPNAESFLIAGAGTGCEGDFQSLLAPYFSEDWDVVNDRRKKGEAALRERVANFLEQLALFEGVVGPTREAFRAAREKALEVVRPQLESVAIQMAAEGRWLRDEGVRIAEETGNLEALAREIRDREEAIGARKAVQQTLESELEEGTRRLAQIEGGLATAQQLVETRQGDMERAKSRLADVRLACGGRPYDSCPDEEARREFDRSRYEANVAISQAMQAWIEAIQGKNDRQKEVFSLRRQLLAKRRDLMMTVREIGRGSAELWTREADFQARTGRLRSARELHEAISEGHRRDQRTLDGVAAEIARDVAKL